MATRKVKLGCIPALILLLLIAISGGLALGLLMGVARMVAGWFS